MPDGSRRDRAGGRAHRQPVSTLEIVASGAGLILTLAMLAFIGWEALTRPGDARPAITVEAGRISHEGGVWVVGFEAVNHAPATATNVEIVGTIRREGRVIETGRAMLNYVPGGSSARGGLFFATDPVGEALELRALGYADP